MITDDLATLVRSAVFAARDAGEFTLSDEDFAVPLVTPRQKEHGDFSSTVALSLKKSTGINDSRVIANHILRHLPADNPLIARTDLAGPGFINFYLKPDWLHAVLPRIEAEDAAFGTNRSRAGEKVLIEFVSANPTGPISVVNGRAAALGDVLGNLLASQGCAVGREFYVNDALNSTQMEIFAESVIARYLQQLGHPLTFADGRTEPGVAQADGESAKSPVEFPEKGYPGDYVREIASKIVAEVGARYETGDEAERNAYFREATLRYMIASQRAALEAFGLHYDSWFFESSLYQSGAVEETIAKLKERGYAYEKDGALWLRSTELGDDKDRVLIRSNEKATYIAADAAYHDNKFQRGYTHLIDIWGADHHGYVGRLKAGVAALGYDPQHLQIVLTQMVSLVRDGEAVIGGKRKGNVIELKEDLIDEIGKDAARFYFLLNSYETPATVDVELAKKQSNDNPVYYVQYAHARLSNILRTAEARGLSREPAAEIALSCLTHPSELDVLRKLTDYPNEVTTSAVDFAPHRLTRFAMDLASLMNVFYENCRVLPGTDESISPEVTKARLALVNGARIVLRNLLTVLGVSAPDKM
ncbi:MAG: arginyl-tRNA synthetase [Chthonomonadaceae bacterium]|nr:arginyl-tRNA synthetase [Chthonomonadaceae bacterium]